jgi:hypothetical protein
LRGEAGMQRPVTTTGGDLEAGLLAQCIRCTTDPGKINGVRFFFRENRS